MKSKYKYEVVIKRTNDSGVEEVLNTIDIPNSKVKVVLVDDTGTKKVNYRKRKSLSDAEVIAIANILIKAIDRGESVEDAISVAATLAHTNINTAKKYLCAINHIYNTGAYFCAGCSKRYNVLFTKAVNDYKSTMKTKVKKAKKSANTVVECKHAKTKH